MTYPCESCNKTYTSAIGLGQHRSKCRGRVKHATEHLNKHKAALDEEESRKRMRMEDTFVQPQQWYEASPPPPSPPGRRSRTGRRVRVPRGWQDFVPTSCKDLPSQITEAFASPPPSVPLPSTPPPALVQEPASVPFETEPDQFGVFHRYLDIPMRQPASSSKHTVLDHLKPKETADVDVDKYPAIRWLNRPAKESVPGPYGPFSNKSVYLICKWFYNSANTKSLLDLDALVKTLQTEGFSLSDLDHFLARREMQHLDEYVNPVGVFSQEDGWHEGSLELALHKAGVKYNSEEDTPIFTMDGLHFRKILEVIISEVQDRRFADERHWLPHKTFWRPPSQPSCADTESKAHETHDHHSSPAAKPPSSHGSPPSSPGSQPDGLPEPIRIFSEMYNSNSMNQAHKKLCSQPRNPDDLPSVEYAILPLLLWSDATLLALFGSAKLWPIYLYIANIMKYVRGMPTDFVAQHLAYVPALPDDLLDYYREHYKHAPTEETLRWLRGELMQKVWSKLLDDDFVHAYIHGILVECADGVVRRLFPQFFTYSADYPEKVLLTAIKNLGKCPCPRCHIKLSQISQSGTHVDDQRRAHECVDGCALRNDIKRACKWLFTHGYAVTSKRIRNVLDGRSLVPIQAAFSQCLGEVDAGFNFYEIFAPDLMHEFELSIWKGTFLHLMRLLHAQGRDVVQEFDRRMRAMPTFGHDTIRRFWNNISRQNRLAARDFEDFLITSLPAFEGLLPLRDDQTVQDLLFELVNWHALASLRLHTSVTLDIWRAATRHMYASMRVFAHTTCKRIAARELPQETQARARRVHARKKNQLSVAPAVKASAAEGPRVVKFNIINTYKYHALGHHPDYVERSGSTDNYNTRTGELEHHSVKGVFARTNKHQFERQIAKHQRH
ncbi:hypothetical protein BN946_scf184746.g28 [Trametes cinnabarina]|uniref:C2H2-type domain-containing protein n=1 Tax=Pycnoporus cinnabarinus TaxID=5643 RepID=A0A060S4K1_PYCCI|nr:hypothetical protein BN946_scf184746.g28 [Trametes cinnabarina]